MQLVSLVPLLPDILRFAATTIILFLALSTTGKINLKHVLWYLLCSLILGLIAIILSDSYGLQFNSPKLITYTLLSILLVGNSNPSIKLFERKRTLFYVCPGICLPLFLLMAMGGYLGHENYPEINLISAPEFFYLICNAIAMYFILHSMDHIRSATMSILFTSILVVLGDSFGESDSVMVYITTVALLYIPMSIILTIPKVGFYIAVIYGSLYLISLKHVPTDAISLILVVLALLIYLSIPLLLIYEEASEDSNDLMNEDI